MLIVREIEFVEIQKAARQVFDEACVCLGAGFSAVSLAVGHQLAGLPTGEVPAEMAGFQLS